MGVRVLTTLRRLKPSQVAFETSLSGILRHAGYSPSDWDVGLWITSRKKIRELNAEYRGIRRSTDILSFAAHTLPEPEQWPADIDSIPPGKDLGDMVLALEVALAAAKQSNLSPQLLIPRLLIHGTVHLLGYDHENEADFAAMLAAEQRLLSAYHADTSLPGSVAATGPASHMQFVLPE